MGEIDKNILLYYTTKMIYLNIPHYWINHLSFQIRKELETLFAAAGHNVSAEEWAILLILNSHTTLSPSSLSRMTFRDKTTITRLVSRLEQRGWVKRNRNESDRRSIEISMSSAGREAFTHLAQIAHSLIETSLKGLCANDIDQMIRTMTTISENLLRPERKSNAV